MKSFFRLTLTIAAAALLFSSCSKKNKEGKMVPKNAMFVAYLNTKSLREKLSWDDIKQTSWYKKMYADSTTKDWMKKLMDNPGNSGIDMDGGLTFFAVKDPGTDGEIALVGHIKNKSDFEQFNKNLDASATTKTDGNLSMLSLKEESVVAWNDKNFVYAFNQGSLRSKMPSMSGLPNGMANNNAMAPGADGNAALFAVCKNLFSLKSDSSLEKNDRFGDLLAEKGDVHAWVNTEEIMKSSPSMGALGMLKLDIFLKDNISTYTATFENGSIDVKQKAYVGKEFFDFLKKYSGGNLNTDMIKSLPSQDVIGILAMNYKPEGVKELIKLTGMDGFLNMYTTQMGFNLDDFVKANKGDLTLAATDLTMKTDSFSYKDDAGNVTNSNVFSKPDLNYLFSVSINDKPSFQKLIDAGKKAMGQMGGSDTSISYGQNDKLFAISNHQHFLNDYLAGKANSKFDFTDKLSGHPVGVFVDIHKILAAFANEKTRSAGDEQIMAESLKLWNNVYYTAGDIDKDAITGHTQINLIDQNTNSLKQLNHYFDVIAKVEMEQKATMENDMKNDSLMVPPPLDTVGHK